MVFLELIDFNVADRVGIGPAWALMPNIAMVAAKTAVRRELEDFILNLPCMWRRIGAAGAG